MLCFIYIYIYICCYIICIHTLICIFNCSMQAGIYTYIIVIAVFVYLFSFVYIQTHAYTYIHIYNRFYLFACVERARTWQSEREREGSLREVVAAFASQVQDVLKEKNFVRARRHLNRWPVSRWDGLSITISGMDWVGCKSTRIFTIHSWWAGWLGAWPKFDSFHWAGLFKGDSRVILVRSGFVC